MPTTTAAMEANAFKAGIVRLLAAEIREWTMEEVLHKTEALRQLLGLEVDQLCAAVCGPSQVIVLIGGAVVERDAIMAEKLRVQPAELTARDFLLKGLGHMEDRAESYDKPEGERSMEATVEAFNAITGCDLNETEGWLFMAVLKMVRSQQGGPFKADNFEDLAAYAGLAGEAAARRKRRIDDDALEDAA